MTNPKTTLMPDMKRVLDCIIKRFTDRVSEEETEDRQQPRNQKRTYYYKWVHTSHIAYDLCITPAQARLRLNKLEKLGFVDANRHSNWISWAANVSLIPGFQQHEYGDYYERVKQ